MRTMCQCVCVNMWVWTSVCMCLFNLFGVGLSSSTGVHKLFYMWQVQQMTHWHGHIVVDPQTNHLFKRHFKRHSKRQPDGAWKILCCLLFSICNHSTWFADFLWCVKCCARIYKNSAAGHMVELKQCEKWELSLSVCLYNHNTWVLCAPHQSLSVQYRSQAPSESSISSWTKEKKNSRHPKQSFLHCLL